MNWNQIPRIPQRDGYGQGLLDLCAARSCGALVTAEEHQLAGGLFGAVSEVVVRTCPVPMEAVAVQDTFGESGPPEALLVRYGLNADAIAQAVRRCLARKG